MGERGFLENGRMRKHSSGEIKDFSQLRKNFYKKELDIVRLLSVAFIFCIVWGLSREEYRLSETFFF